MSRWDAKYDAPLVSVMCLAYNHEKYIEDALKGFLIQETDFPFEVLIHDDASTDRTADIIREYEKRYPHIIKPIYQKENQWSKNKGVIRDAQYGRTQGMYIALCEGDDYWCHKYKLQTQIDAMFLNDNVDISFHSAMAVDVESGRVDKIAEYLNETKVFSVEDVILGGGGFMPTASIIYKKEIRPLIAYWRDKAPVGDVVMQFIGALKGGALYLPNVFSVYRVGTPSSWTVRMRNIDARIALNKKMNIYYKSLAEEMPVYKNCIRKKVIKNNVGFLFFLLKSKDIKESILVINFIIKTLLYK